MSIKAYQYKNDQWWNCRGPQSGWYRLYSGLADHLSNEYNVEIVTETNQNYWEDKKNSMYIETLGFEMYDTCFLIHNDSNDSLIGISNSENDLCGMLNLFRKRNKPEDSLFISQFYNWTITKTDGSPLEQDDQSHYNFKILRTPYYVCNEDVDLDSFYEKRKAIDFNDQINLIFMKSGHSSRPDLKILHELGYSCDPLPLSPHEEYYNMAIQHKMGLCIGACAEYSEREIEYLGLGLPYMRLDYQTKLAPALEPGKHYISIDRDYWLSDLPKDRGADCQGGPQYVDCYIKRFKELQNEKDYLDYVARNGREYYENYCSPKNKLSHFLKLLKLEDFIK